MNGFFNVIKSSGTNSTFIVNRIKRICKTPCGHMGTLDPMASGVLPVAVGKSTRMFPYLTDKIKEYVAEFTFGYETDTLDAMGKVIQTCDKTPTKQEILDVLPTFMGEISQIPPKYCANNINGKRGYDLARRGIEFELKAKKINVYSLDLIEQVAQNVYKFRIECGKGTYIRSLCRDIAYAVGSMGTMTSLVRTKSGIFNIENAITVEELEKNPEKYLIKADQTVTYEQIYLTEKQSQKLLNGVYEIKNENEGKLYRVYSPTEFFGIGIIENGYLKIKAYIRDGN